MVTSKTNDNKTGLFMITQQLTDSSYWSNTDDGKPLLDNIEVAPLEDIVKAIVDRINQGGDTKSRGVLTPLNVEHAQGIIHDADTHASGAEKSKHLHLLVKVKNRVRLESVAKWLGIEPQYIEKAKRGRYAEENMMAYLTHANDLDKHQYEPTEVVSFGSVDYGEYWAEHEEKWSKSAVTQKKKKIKGDIDWVLEQVRLGELTEDDFVDEDNADLQVIYAENKNRVDSWLNVFARVRARATMKKIDSGEIKMRSYFITGAPGSGKTRYANLLIQDIQKKAKLEQNETWRVHRAAATNPMDGYTGQEIILLDDLRVSAMTASDWLKLLDPFNVSTMSARYQNRVQASRVIIITAYIDPVQFFYFAKGNGGQSEALDQFLRRLESTVKIIRTPTGDWNDTKVIRQNLIEYVGDAEVHHKFEIKNNDDYSREVTVKSKYGFGGAREESIDGSITEISADIVENRDSKVLRVGRNGIIEPEAKTQDDKSF